MEVDQQVLAEKATQVLAENAAQFPNTANTPRVVSGITLYNSKVNDSCEKV